MFVFVCECLCWCALHLIHFFLLYFVLIFYYIAIVVVWEFFFVSLLWFVTAHRLSAGRIGCLRERLITQEKSYETLRAHEKRGKRRRLQKYYLKKHHQRENKLTSATKFEHRFLFRILKLGGICFFFLLLLKCWTVTNKRKEIAICLLFICFFIIFSFAPYTFGPT